MAMALTGCAWAPCSSFQFQGQRLLPATAPLLKVCCKATSSQKKGWRADDTAIKLQILRKGKASNERRGSRMSSKTKRTSSKRDFDSDDENEYEHSGKSRVSSKTKRTSSKRDFDSDDENEYERKGKSRVSSKTKRTASKRDFDSGDEERSGKSQMSSKTKRTASKRDFDSGDENEYERSGKSRMSSRPKGTVSRRVFDSDEYVHRTKFSMFSKTKGKATNFDEDDDVHNTKFRMFSKTKGKANDERSRKSRKSGKSKAQDEWPDPDKKKKPRKLSIESVLTGMSRQSDDEYDALDDMDDTEATAWLENKPLGFGVGKKYDTSVEDELLAQIEEEERARKRGEKMPKVQVQQKKAPEPEPDGYEVDIRKLPRKRNITRDLKAAFKGVNGLLFIKPMENKNSKTREPLCKGSATLIFNSSFNAVNFIKKFRNQAVTFGDEERKPIYSLLGKKKGQAGEGATIQNSETKQSAREPTLKEEDNHPKAATKAKSKTKAARKASLTPSLREDWTEDSDDDVLEDEQLIESLTDAIVIESTDEEEDQETQGDDELRLAKARIKDGDVSDSEVDQDEEEFELEAGLEEDWYEDESDEEFEEDDELSDEFDVDAVLEDGDSEEDYSDDDEEELEEDFSSDELSDDDFEVEAELGDESEDDDSSEWLDEEGEVLNGEREVEATLKISNGDSDDGKVEVEQSMKAGERDDEVEVGSSGLLCTEASIEVAECRDLIKVPQNTMALAPVIKGLQPLFDREHDLRELREKEQKLLDKIIRAGKKRAGRNAKLMTTLTFSEASKRMAKLTLEIRRVKKHRNRLVKRNKTLKAQHTTKKLNHLKRLRDSVIGLRRYVITNAKMEAKLANRRKREAARAAWLNDKEKREARLLHFLTELKHRESYDQEQKALADEQQEDGSEPLRLSE